MTLVVQRRVMFRYLLLRLEHMNTKYQKVAKLHVT